MTRACRTSPLAAARAGASALATIRACVLIAVLALSAGCSVSTTLPDLPRTTPAGWQSPASAGPAGLKPDLERWWLIFDDRTLDRLIERALSENLNVKIAAQRLDRKTHV